MNLSLELKKGDTPKFALVAPILIATPKPCKISALPKPMICIPTTRSALACLHPRNTIRSFTYEFVCSWTFLLQHCVVHSDELTLVYLDILITVLLPGFRLG